jgi:YVTN family beta-propeller protein
VLDISPDGKRLYIDDGSNFRVLVFDTQQGVVVGQVNLEGDKAVGGEVLNASGSTLYIVTNWLASSPPSPQPHIDVIDTTTLAVVSMPAIAPLVGLSATTVSLTPDGASLYVTYAGTPGGVVVLDTSTYAVAANIALGSNPAPWGQYIALVPQSQPAAVKLAFRQQPPAQATVGTTFSASVAVEDASGQTATTDAGRMITLSATGGSGQLACTPNSATDVGGTATFSCTINQGGAYILHAKSPGLAPARSPSITVIARLVVFTPGIDLTQSPTNFDPYVHAYNTFATILAALHCPAPSSGSSETLSASGSRPVLPPFAKESTLGPLVLCAQSGIAWLPYSYSGIAPASNAVRSFFGDTTGQPLAQSAAAMDDVVTLGRQTLSAPLPLFVVGHSLGGAVASFWGGMPVNQSATIITLDSPVNGTWPSLSSLEGYCLEPSVGLLESVKGFAPSVALCPFIPVVAPALDPAKARVMIDLNTDADIEQMGQANSYNFAYAYDAVVPSWYAVTPTAAAGGHAVLMNAAPPSNCDLASKLCNLYHTVILDGAAHDVVQLLRAGTPPSASAIRRQLTLTVCNDTPLLAANVSATWPAHSTINLPSPAQATVSGSRCGTLTIPWENVTVSVNIGIGNGTIAILPGQDKNIKIRCSESLNSLASVDCRGG